MITCLDLVFSRMKRNDLTVSAISKAIFVMKLEEPLVKLFAMKLSYTHKRTNGGCPRGVMVKAMDC